jgi:YjbE family integral membrane protein
MIEFFTDPDSWAKLLKIFWINILLSGDNAVVIALAVRSLPAKQQRMGIILGAGGAIVLRVILTYFVDLLAGLPFLKIVGAALLVWIGVKLIAPGDEGHANVKETDNLWAAFRTILIADVVMSLDNVLGVYGAAGGSWPHILVGLATSVPLVIFGSQVILKIMDRFPIIITLGGALLGFVAGEMALDDFKVRPLLESSALRGDCQPLVAQAAALGECVAHAVHNWQMVSGAVGAIVVVAIGMWLARSAKRAEPEAIEEIPLRK